MLRILSLIAILATVRQTAASLTEVKKLASQNTQFAVELYKKVAAASANDNVFLSPISISTALAMTYAGAKGNTAKEMEKVLMFKDQNVHKIFQELLQSLNASATTHELKLANALFGKKGYTFVDKFKTDMTSLYKAGLRELDFSKAEEARTLINKWIEDNTGGKIKDMIPPGSLNAGTALVLVNAIYFKGLWDQKFDPKDTSPKDFYVEKAKTIKVPTMTMTKYLNYAAVPELDAEILEMPYKGEKASMYFILPNQTDGLNSLEGALTGSKLTSAISKVERKQVVVSLPKFSFIQSVNLKKILFELGISDLFFKADLSGISAQGLFVSEVLHKTFIKLDEYGTEAAASTVVTLPTGGWQSVDFTVNRPFLFAIRDTDTESILFLGRVTKPSTDATTAYTVGKFADGGPTSGVALPRPTALASLISLLITIFIKLF